jgi:hypothetical protein
MPRVFHSYDVPPRIEPRHASVVSRLLRLYGKSPEGVRKAMELASRGRAAAPGRRGRATAPRAGSFVSKKAGADDWRQAVLTDSNEDRPWNSITLASVSLARCTTK